MQSALFMCKSVITAAKCTVHVQMGDHSCKVHCSYPSRCSYIQSAPFMYKSVLRAAKMHLQRQLWNFTFAVAKMRGSFAAAISTLHRPNCLLFLTCFLFLSPSLKSWRKKPISCSTLRSASGTLSLQIPRTRLNSTVGSRTCSAFGPSTWYE